MAWMIGTWVGVGDMPGMGKYTDEMTLSWLKGNPNFMLGDYVMKVSDKQVWCDTTIIGWDDDEHRIVSYTFGMDGSIGRGMYSDPTEKDAWTCEGKKTGQGPMKESRCTMKKIDDDTMQFTMDQKVDGEWKPAMTTVSRRKPD